MNIILQRTVCALLLILAQVASAGDREDADKAARTILDLLQAGKYESVWNAHMSEFFKSKMTKDSFMANMSIGRQQLGAPVATKFVDMAYTQMDPTTGTKGEIYAFNYMNSYAAGNFYERVVVIKEKDGKFRLSGLWGSPTPK